MKIIIIISIAIFLYLIVSIILYYKRMNKLKTNKLSPKIVLLNDTNFESEIKTGVLLVDFWASWCMPCLMQAPILDEIANENTTNVQICKLDVQSNQKSAEKYNVRSIPTMILFKDGFEIQRFVGVKPKHFLIKAINNI